MLCADIYQRGLQRGALLSEVGSMNEFLLLAVIIIYFAICYSGV
jgi:hypothetical protein